MLLVLSLITISVIIAGVWIIRRLQIRLRRIANALSAAKQSKLDLHRDLRTPLTAVIGCSEQLSHTPLEKDQRELLHTIEDAADNLMDILKSTPCMEDHHIVSTSPTQTVIITQREVNHMSSGFLKGKHVLVADDQEMNLLLVTRILTRWQCKFDKALNGLEAWDLFCSNAYDLVLLDIQMPHMTGLEVVRRIRREHDPLKSAVPVLAITSDISISADDKFKEAGFNDCLLKPFKERDMYNTIIKHLPPVNIEAK